VIEAAPVAATPAPAQEPKPAATTEPPAEKSTAPAATPAETTQTQAQLKVIAPTPETVTEKPGEGAAESASATTAPVPAAPQATGADINKELALTTEAVETQRQETAELRTRLSDLEQQISTMQKLMKVKDEQLALMQSKNTGPAGAAARNETTDLMSNPTTLAMIGIVAVVLAALLWLAMRQRQRVTAVTPPRYERRPLHPRRPLSLATRQ